ncbi:MAG: hypothetical protein GXO79_16190 [Chlorobi bacterium]|nr:hypothetical protein [Chlorobiota bacterium]
MSNFQGFYFIIILLLFFYIIYLQYKLHKNNKLVISLKKLIEVKKQYSKEDFKKILKQIADFNFNLIIPKDKILENKIYDYIFENEKETIIFLHYTKDREVAELIVKNGFKYRNSFYKTAENVYNDKVDFLNKHMRHKHFGKFVIILSIAKRTYNYYLNEINKGDNQKLLIEHVLSLEKVVKNDNEDNIYTIPTQFVKGYLNYETGEIQNNLNFDYNFDSEMFKRNIATNRY